MELRRMRRVGAVVSAAWLLAACSGDAAPQDRAAPSPTSDGGHSHSVGAPIDNYAFTLGSPPAGAVPTRTIRVETRRGFAYDPPRLEVRAGDTIRFEVTNVDAIPHEFVLGNQPYQQVHESQARSGGVPHDYSAYSVHVGADETRSFDWTFDRAGVVLYACHLPGHFDRGMVGRIRVT